MYVKFWGTRGSIAKAGPTTIRYGGNTSCVEVRSDAGTILVIDCGTGAHGLGAALLEEADGAALEGHVLISHTHWDHIQGLPFFAPLFVPDHRWHVYGPKGLGDSIADTLSGQMEYSYFPVSIEQLGGVTAYHDLVEGEFQIDDVHISTHYLNHPALTLGFRLEVDGASVVYLCDHEPHHRGLAAGGSIGDSENDRIHAEFAAGADLLIHDAQYLADEYAARVGWGHSTVEYVVDVARHAGVAKVALTHHDPSRTDEDVDDLVERARDHADGFTGEIFAAAEGMQIDLDRTGRTSRTAAEALSATRHLALDEIGRSCVIAVQTPAIAEALREVADAEGCAVESLPLGELVEAVRRERPALIIVEADTDRVLELAAQLDEIDPDDDRDVTLVAIGDVPEIADESRPHVADWLAWPASTVYLRTKIRAWLLRRACRWQPAPRPADEERRLASLRSLDVLDTDREERFDQLTRLASERFDVPIAIVSLVDEHRQWFKSTVGFDADESPRDFSFCAHAILDDAVFQIPDALDDPRFADNPVVSGDPRIRFYAGVPLTVSDGSRVGSFCVVDYRPRLLDDEQLSELRRLGERVVRELESG